MPRKTRASTSKAKSPSAKKASTKAGGLKTADKEIKSPPTPSSRRNSNRRRRRQNEDSSDDDEVEVEEEEEIVILGDENIDNMEELVVEDDHNTTNDDIGSDNNNTQNTSAMTQTQHKQQPTQETNHDPSSPVDVATNASMEEEENAEQDMDTPIVEDPDQDTIRIMLSTDNHLGYNENDISRGNDSFSALEEVLYLAKFYHCDLVLLAGDLFHDNRPSRRTLYKTMDIFRRYCMGPDAIQVQILSSSLTTTSANSKNKNSPTSASQINNNNNNASQSSRNPLVRGFVNYEDEYYSIDLPVFSIHGNHDDPSRDGGNSELYAALDLLDVTNLVNYFGKQQDSQEIRIDPILLKKGSTHVALYGLGSMRDERLNRMWRGEQLSFSRPSSAENNNNDDDEDDATTPTWFNIFALHQNRDYGRGSKNTIKEDMIPEWMDFVCWGHEHECCIEVQESVVGTFRISQPGSSVATSLVEGESERKKVGLLDIKETAFRLTAIPLTQVRSFVLGNVNLAQEPRLDPDDPKVDMKVSKLLEEKVRVLIHDAREKRQELLQAAKEQGNVLAKYFMGDAKKSKNQSHLNHVMEKEDEVLVRLKVDHTGFVALNNQRFGAKFVGDVANPTDILLFHRKKAEGISRSKASVKNVKPLEPSEIEEMNIEELIVEELEANDKKLELFDDKKISSALDSYVGKQEAQAINDTLNHLLGKQQKKLIKKGVASVSQGLEEEVPNDDEREKENKRSEKSGKRKKHGSGDDDDNDFADDDDEAMEESSKSRSTKKGTRKGLSSRSSSNKSYDDDDDFDNYDDDEEMEAPKSKSTKRGRKPVKYTEDSDDDDDDEVVEVNAPTRGRRNSPRRKKKSIDYSMDDSDDDEIEILDDPPPPKKKKTSNSKPSKSTSGRKRGSSIDSKGSGGPSQSQLSFQSIQRKPAEKSSRSKGRSYSVDSDDDDGFTPSGRSRYADDDDWGIAASRK